MLNLSPRKTLRLAPFASKYCIYANNHAALLCRIFDKGATLACTNSGMQVIYSKDGAKPVDRFIQVGDAASKNLLYNVIELYNLIELQAWLPKLPESYVVSGKVIPVTSIQVTMQTRVNILDYDVLR